MTWSKAGDAPSGWNNANPNKHSWERVNAQKGSLDPVSDDSGGLTLNCVRLPPDYDITKVYEYFADFQKCIVDNANIKYLPNGVVGNLPHSYRSDNSIVYTAIAEPDGIYVHWSGGSKKISDSGMNPHVCADELNHIACVYESEYGEVIVYDERVQAGEIVGYTTTLGLYRPYGIIEDWENVKDKYHYGEARILTDETRDLIVVWYNNQSEAFGTTHRIYLYSVHQEWGIDVEGESTKDFTCIPTSLMPDPNTNHVRLLEVIAINRGLDRTHRHCILVIWALSFHNSSGDDGKIHLAYTESQSLPFIAYPLEPMTGIVDLQTILYNYVSNGKSSNTLIGNVDLLSVDWFIPFVATILAQYSDDAMLARVDLQPIVWIINSFRWITQLLAGKVDLYSMMWAIDTIKYSDNTLVGDVQLLPIVWINNKHYEMRETLLGNISLQSITWTP